MPKLRPPPTLPELIQLYQHMAALWEGTDAGAVHAAVRDALIRLRDQDEKVATLKREYDVWADLPDVALSLEVMNAIGDLCFPEEG